MRLLTMNTKAHNKQQNSYRGNRNAVVYLDQSISRLIDNTTQAVFHNSVILSNDYVFLLSGCIQLRKCENIIQNEAVVRE